MRKFFSLKWKITFVVGIVSAFSVFLLQIQHYWHIEDILKKKSDNQLSGYELQFNALINNRSLELETLASTFSQIDLSQPIDAIKPSLLSLFSNLEIHTDITGLHILTGNGKLLFQRKTTLSKNALNDLAQQVITTERPYYYIDCPSSALCTQYIATPLINPNTGNMYIVVLGQTLANVVTDFQHLTNQDIGLFTQQSISTQPPTALILSHYAQLKPNLPSLLHSFKSQPDSIAFVDETFYLMKQMRVNDSKYENREKVFFITFVDITNDITTFQTLKRQNLVIGVLSLLLLIGLLLGLLIHPSLRLQKLSRSLPLLATNRFDDFKKHMAQRNFHIFDDEVDRVANTARHLSDQLQNLNSELHERSSTLEQQKKQLIIERNHMRTLLDSAKLMIFTTNDNGMIQSANKYAQELSEYSHSELSRMNISELIMNDDDFNARRPLPHSQIKFYSGDRLLTSKTNKTHTISWQHTPIYQKGDTIKQILSIGANISDRIETEKRLNWLSNHDTLTNLPNRRDFEHELQLILNLSANYNHTGALLFCGLDNFKLINDTYGHKVGDILLRQVASLLKHQIRSTDIVARLGGDEFAIILPETNQTKATHLAKKITDAFQSSVFDVNKQSLSISISSGIVMFPAMGENIVDLMALADVAMYQAKQSTTEKYMLYSANEDRREVFSSQLKIKHLIETAIEDNRFILYFQPILSLRTGHISHFEALIRMYDHQDNLVRPDEFIPLAEKLGLIAKIDRWVIRQVRNLLNQAAQQHHFPSVAVNLSGKHFDHSDLFEYISDQLSNVSFSKQQMIFEITETAALSDLTAANTLITNLRYLGCKFALDDFGVGFSSFLYLKQLKVDYVKIDGAFIQGLSDSRENQVFVKALQQVAEGLNLQTIAEYVEDEDTLILLRSYGVNFAQGYHIGQPKPLENGFQPAEKPH